MVRSENTASSPSWRSRLLWFVGLWVAGVTTLTVIAYAIRWMIMP